MPLNDQFDWPALSGVVLDGHAAYPTYDHASPQAAKQGRALVQRVSDDVLSDDAGVLAYALSSYVADGALPSARVLAGGDCVSVENGWYLLVAPGRRPLFAWVDGAPVELGDKSDTPVAYKQVNTGSG